MQEESLKRSIPVSPLKSPKRLCTRHSSIIEEDKKLRFVFDNGKERVVWFVSEKSIKSLNPQVICSAGDDSEIIVKSEELLPSSFEALWNFLSGFDLELKDLAAAFEGAVFFDSLVIISEISLAMEKSLQGTILLFNISAKLNRIDIYERLGLEIALKSDFFNNDIITLYTKKSFGLLLKRTWWINAKEDRLLECTKFICKDCNDVDAIEMLKNIRVDALTSECIQTNWALLSLNPLLFLKSLEKRFGKPSKKAKDRCQFPSTLMFEEEDTLPLTMETKKFLWEEMWIPRESKWRKMRFGKTSLLEALTTPSVEMLLFLFPQDNRGQPEVMVFYFREFQILRILQNEEDYEYPVFSPGEQSFVGIKDSIVRLLNLTESYEAGFPTRDGPFLLKNSCQEIKINTDMSNVWFSGQVNLHFLAKVHGYTRNTTE